MAEIQIYITVEEEHRHQVGETITRFLDSLDFDFEFEYDYNEVDPFDHHDEPIDDWDDKLEDELFPTGWF